MIEFFFISGQAIFSEPVRFLFTNINVYVFCVFQDDLMMSRLLLVFLVMIPIVSFVHAERFVTYNWIYTTAVVHFVLFNTRGIMTHVFSMYLMSNIISQNGHWACVTGRLLDDRLFLAEFLLFGWNEIESSRARKAKTAHIITKQLINFAVFAVKAVGFVTNRSFFRPKPGAHPENFEREDRNTCRLFVYYIFID